MNEKGVNMVDFVFNSDFGLRIVNNMTRGSKKDNYLDLDLDFRKTTKRLFVVFHA